MERNWRHIKKTRYVNAAGVCLLILFPTYIFICPVCFSFCSVFFLLLLRGLFCPATLFALSIIDYFVTDFFPPSRFCDCGQCEQSIEMVL